jgi:hypothetical protein
LQPLFGEIVNSESYIDTVPGNSEIFLSLLIPPQSASGYYKLEVECTNSGGRVEALRPLITVSGLAASITSVSDKDVYLSSEDVQIVTDIVNGDLEVTGGSLVRQIWQTSVSQEDVEEAWVNTYDYDSRMIILKI